MSTKPQTIGGKVDARTAQLAISPRVAHDDLTQSRSRLIAGMRRFLVVIRQPSEIDVAWTRTSSAAQFHLLAPREQNRLLDRGFRL